MLNDIISPKLAQIASKIDIYADIKNKFEILQYKESSLIKGFTCNPTLIRKGGATDYLDFVYEAIENIGNLNISIEVIADDFDAMYRQAHVLHKISPQIYVKIPIYNTKRNSSIQTIKKLLQDGVPLNVTAVMTVQQLNNLCQVVTPTNNLIVSIFAGRIADTGINPMPIIKHSVDIFENYFNVRTLWASPRELLNIQQAIECGCNIITVVPEVLAKINLIGKDLDDYSLETVKMFYHDALESNYKL
jgi:transaldolase